ncbi:hypothetical protein HMPREF0653_01734 [Prevotella disiens JCM 6334 = ATCC 29426]|uniref:Uncharacterized protein n=1 Tax=Prevotella disiens JCM 6334 = ATCC 29426 TaxID=1235811 RepID=A0ABP2Y6Z9_9BACT|nr:hypothetical protein HMPREF0653_01734 [Prevotella disiens JCM 6334 = ATCC 29426]
MECDSKNIFFTKEEHFIHAFMVSMLIAKERKINENGKIMRTKR